MSTDTSSIHSEDIDSERDSFITRIKQRGKSMLESRHGGTLLFIGLFVLIATLVRGAFFIRSITSVTWDWTLPAGFAVGFIFDLAMAVFFVVPMACFLSVVPKGWFSLKWFRALIHVMFILALGLFLFGAVSEWVFWSEFFVRFNFIAVDYLVYTREVVRNIQESYNMPLIYAGLALTTFVAYGL
ncbi:MAG: hypothetical protein LBV12_08560, partial [Puniceicoccales bacterium]|nr:hypothetical protein [Puniceicoccales bacterium]